MTSEPTAKIWNTVTRESKTCSQAQADNLARNTRGEWSFREPLPEGWNKEIPKYKLQTALEPSPLARHRFENPITFSTSSTLWQYAEKPLAAGQIVETTSWPHLSMQPLNHSAIAVRDFLRDHMKSRLPLSPWKSGRLYLDDGLSGAPPEQATLRPNLPSPAVPTPVRVAR